MSKEEKNEALNVDALIASLQESNRRGEEDFKEDFAKLKANCKELLEDLFPSPPTVSKETSSSFNYRQELAELQTELYALKDAARFVREESLAEKALQNPGILEWIARYESEKKKG